MTGEGAAEHPPLQLPASFSASQHSVSCPLLVPKWVTLCWGLPWPRTGASLRCLIQNLFCGEISCVHLFHLDQSPNGMYQLSAMPQPSTQRLRFYFFPADVLVDAGKAAASSSHTGQTGSGEPFPVQVWEDTGVSAEQPGLVGPGHPLLESWHHRERLCKSLASITWSALQRETFVKCINKCTREQGREKREIHQYIQYSL